MNRFVATLGTLIAACLLFWFFPLFLVVPRGAAQAAKNEAEFNATDFAQEFWTGQLLPARSKAADVTEVLAALRDDPQRARAEFGRSAGLGRSSLFFLRGRGRIVSVDEQAISVSISAGGNQADVAIQTGLLFGNMLRDATGLISGSSFQNSQQFNEISTALNRLVETQLLPRLKHRAKVGTEIEYVGCAEVTNLPRDISPLKVVPVDVILP